MTFWPVTLEHPDQLELEVGEEKPYPTLQQHPRESSIDAAHNGARRTA